jgi:hypothetical protein
MIDRRSLLLGVTALSLNTVTRALPAFAQAEGTLAILAEAGKALLADLVRDLAKQLSERRFPSKFDEVSAKLDQIAAQVSIVVNILLKLPEMADTAVRQNFEGDTKAIVMSLDPRIRGIASEVATGKSVTADQTALLSQMTADLQSAVGRIWRYGYSVYPIVTHGLLSAITIHKLLKTKRSQIHDLIVDQITERYNKAIDLKDKASFPSLQQNVLAQMYADITYMNSYPRKGLLNCVLIGQGGENRESKRMDTYGSVQPSSGIPRDKFVVVDNQKNQARNSFPGVRYSENCDDRSVDTRGEVETLLNSKLSSMKAHREQAAAFAKITNDVREIIAILGRL